MIKTTARGSYRVFRDRVQESNHATEREAIEAASELKAANPKAYIHYDHDYSVDVELTLYSTQDN